jgi:ABC-type Fe3+/spermidine/putrescine transport system ATPase subunit
VIQVERVGLRLGEFELRAVSLEIERGGYFVLLGPPGSGKSVLLECLCGLKRIESGLIRIDGEDVTRLEPRERHIGYVPQDYALFPHLTVEQNIRFGMRARGFTRTESHQRLAETATMLGIGHLMRRRIAGLSGGERQRTALARALVIRPRVLLLDEPVSTLDESTREAVCAELRRIQREFELTTVHVSHHLEEAFSVADRAGILRDGRLQQVGPLDELLRRPRSAFVARFMRCENLFEGRAIEPTAGDGCRVEVHGQCVTVPGRCEGSVQILIRPEHVELIANRPAADDPTAAVVPVRVIRVADRGAYVRVELDGPMQLTAHVSHAVAIALRLAEGANVHAVIQRDRVHVLPTEQEA